MGEPKVSILIPVYKREKLIIDALNSAVNQTYRNIEIIVVDNKSPDDTFKVAKDFADRYSNLKVYQNEENIGPVRNWLKCLDYATGEYIKILWSDDLIAPTFIEKTLPYLVNYKEVGFVFTATKIEILDSSQSAESINYVIGSTGIYDTEVYIKSALLGISPYVPVSPGCALFRKIDVKKNLLLDIPNKIGNDFKMHAIGPDLLLFLLTAKDYPKFAFINELLSTFRGYKDSISVSSDRFFLALNYNLVKSFFVENYITDKILRKKFNTNLLLFLIRLRRNHKFKSISLQDFYLNEKKINIDYLLFMKLLLSKALRKIRRKLKKLGSFTN